MPHPTLWVARGRARADRDEDEGADAATAAAAAAAAREEEDGGEEEEEEEDGWAVVEAEETKETTLAVVRAVPGGAMGRERTWRASRELREALAVGDDVVDLKRVRVQARVDVARAPVAARVGFSFHVGFPSPASSNDSATADLTRLAWSKRPSAVLSCLMEGLPVCVGAWLAAPWVEAPNAHVRIWSVETFLQPNTDRDAAATGVAVVGERTEWVPHPPPPPHARRLRDRRARAVGADNTSSEFRRAADIVAMVTQSPSKGAGIVVSGPSGSGKSSFVRWLIASLDVEERNVVRIESHWPLSRLATLAGASTATTFTRTRTTGEKAVWLIDDAPAALPRAGGARAVLLTRAIVRARAVNASLVVVAKSWLPLSDLYAGALGAGALDTRVDLGAPDAGERRAQLLRLLGSALVATPATMLDELVRRTAGLSRAQCSAVVARAVARGAPTSTEAWHASLADAVRAVRTRGGSATTATASTTEAKGNDDDLSRRVAGGGGGGGADPLLVSPPDLGGMHHARALVSRAVLVPLAAPHETTSLMNHLGVVLHGPPGNGKTSLARALGAHVVHHGLANFVEVQCVDLVSKFVGETERNVHALFERARKQAPVLLFLDRIETLAPRRDPSAEQTFDRVLSTLLVEMDGVLTSSAAVAGSVVVVVAATQRLDELDDALVRVGRLGTHVFCGPPRSEEECVEVMDASARKTPLHVGGACPTRADVLRRVVREHALMGKSCAELAAVCRDAALRAVKTRGDEAVDVAWEDFLLQ